MKLSAVIIVTLISPCYAMQIIKKDISCDPISIKLIEKLYKRNLPIPTTIIRKLPKVYKAEALNYNYYIRRNLY